MFHGYSVLFDLSASALGKVPKNALVAEFITILPRLGVSLDHHRKDDVSNEKLRGDVDSN